MILIDRKGVYMKPSAVVRTLSLCVVLSAAVPAYATPFETRITPTSSKPGTTITASLFDYGVTDLEGADILLTFDPDIFSYSGSALGSATTSSFILTANLVSDGQLKISLITGDPFPLSGVSGSLVDVSLLIQRYALPGHFNLVFETASTDYDIPATRGTVTLQPGPVPEPASTMLVGMGMLALVGFRRWLAWTAARRGTSG